MDGYRLDVNGNRICSIPGCGDPHKGRGWCRKHLGRWQRWGDPLGGRTGRGEAREFYERSLTYRGPGCLLWPFDTTDGGYPVLQWEGRPQVVGRLVLEALEGPAPSPAHQAAHKPVECHERLCVWGAHLRWATAAENFADRELDGTAPFGEQAPNHKLTDAKVAEILCLVFDGWKDSAIAAEYGVNSGTIWRIRNGETWKHIPRPVK